jgi:hypothetical protein
MDVAFLGHSFIRRLRDDNIHHTKGRHGLDIGTHSDINATLFAKCIGVHHHVRRIYTHTNYILFIKDIARCSLLITKIKPGIVLIDIGSNDLASVTKVNPALMLELATQITDSATQLSSSVIIINGILPRTAGMTASAETFQDNADLYNRFLKNICETSTNLVYNKLRGFTHTWIDNIEQKKPVSDWSTDGIHCNTIESMKRYRTRIKQAILSQIGRAKQ